jgi:hypothetical protein
MQYLVEGARGPLRNALEQSIGERRMASAIQ